MPLKAEPEKYRARMYSYSVESEKHWRLENSFRLHRFRLCVSINASSSLSDFHGYKD